MASFRGVRAGVEFGAKVVAPWMMGLALLAFTLVALHDVVGAISGGGAHQAQGLAWNQPMSWVIATSNPGRIPAVVLLILGLVANWFTLLAVSIMFHLRAGKVFIRGLQAMAFSMWLMVILVLVAPPLTNWGDAFDRGLDDAWMGAAVTLLVFLWGLLLVLCAVIAQRRYLLAVACFFGILCAGLGIAGELGAIPLPALTTRIGAYGLQGVFLVLAYAGYHIQMHEPQVDPEADDIRYTLETVQS